MSERPPFLIVTVTRRASASSEFSTNSFTTEAGRSTTSPAAIWLATCSGRRRMRFTGAVYRAKGACKSEVWTAASELFLQREANLVTATVTVANGVDAVAVADQPIDILHRPEAQTRADAEDIVPIGGGGRHGLHDGPISIGIDGHGLFPAQLLVDFEISHAQ